MTRENRVAIDSLNLIHRDVWSIMGLILPFSTTADVAHVQIETYPVGHEVVHIRRHWSEVQVYADYRIVRGSEPGSYRMHHLDICKQVDGYPLAGWKPRPGADYEVLMSWAEHAADGAVLVLDRWMKKG